MVILMHPVKRGRAAEMIFQAKCLTAGLDCFTPTTEDGRIDALVGPFFYRCQVKVLGARGYCDTKHLSLVKRRGAAGSKTFFRYSARDVDFMVGVCLDTHAVYVVPIASTAAWSKSISEQALERMGCREAFHLLEAAPGENVLPLGPRRVIGRRPDTRPRPSRAWIDTESLPLGLEFDDDDLEQQAG